jgi:predicted ATPase
MRRALRAILALRRGDGAGFPALAGALDAMRASGFQYRYSIYLGMLASSLGAHGRTDAGLAAVDEALAFAEARGEGWCRAELWRIRGELLAAADPDAAAACFARALDAARHQQSRLWTLRAAASLAQLRRRQGRAADGHAALAHAVAAFDEGFDSADLLRARRLLDGGDSDDSGDGEGR